MKRLFSSICLLYGFVITKKWNTTAEKWKLDFFINDHEEEYLKVQLLIKSGYYIAPSPSTALILGLAAQYVFLMTPSAFW